MGHYKCFGPTLVRPEQAIHRSSGTDGKLAVHWTEGHSRTEPRWFTGIVTAVRACGHPGGSVAKGMTKISHSGYRFPPEIIQQAIWLYVRFTLSFRDVEDLLAERGIVVSYETVRRWVNHFGPKIAANLRKRRPKPHTNWHLDEVYLKIGGRLVCVLMGLQPVSLDLPNAMSAVDGATIERRIRISRPDEGRGRCKGSRAWDSAQRFLSIHAATYNTFNVQHHLTSARTHRAFRASAVQTWREVVAAA